MASDITRIRSSAATLTALYHLKLVNNDLAIRGKKLAFGLRLVSASEDPADARIAINMEARKRGLGVAIDNIWDAKNMLTVAEGGLTKIKDVLLNIRDKLMQAANESLGLEEGLSIAAEIRSFMHEIVNIAHQTRWNDLGLLDSSPPPSVSSSASRTFFFHTGSGAGDDVAFNREYIFDTAGIVSEELWQNWQDNADTLTVRLGNIGNPSEAISRKVYDSRNGYVNASAEINLKEVYQSLGVAQKAGIAGASDTHDINASVNALLQKVDALLSATTEWISHVGSMMSRLQMKEEAIMVSKVNVAASLSRIKDADMAKEYMLKTRDDILQNSALAFLSQANVSASNIVGMLVGR